MNFIAGNLEAYTRVSSKLKLGLIPDEFSAKLDSVSSRPRQGLDETDVSRQDKGGQSSYNYKDCDFCSLFRYPRAVLGFS